MPNDYEYCKAEIIRRIDEHVEKACSKHYSFTDTLDTALVVLGCEYGEVLNEACKKADDGWHERMNDEIYDLIAVCIRILLEHYRRESR